MKILGTKKIWQQKFGYEKKFGYESFGDKNIMSKKKLGDEKQFGYEKNWVGFFLNTTVSISG